MDCLLLAKTIVSNIKGCLAAGEFVEAWHHLKGWYCSAEDRAPKPCQEMLATHTQERIDLYVVHHPPKEMLPFQVNPLLSLMRPRWTQSFDWWWDNYGLFAPLAQRG